MLVTKYLDISLRRAFTVEVPDNASETDVVDALVEEATNTLGDVTVMKVAED